MSKQKTYILYLMKMMFSSWIYFKRRKNRSHDQIGPFTQSQIIPFQTPLLYVSSTQFPEIQSHETFLNHHEEFLKRAQQKLFTKINLSQKRLEQIAVFVSWNLDLYQIEIKRLNIEIKQNTLLILVALSTHDKAISRSSIISVFTLSICSDC